MRSLVIAALVFHATAEPSARAHQPSPDALALARAVFASIAAGRFADVEERFTPEMTAALPSGRLREMWTRLLRQAGAYKRCDTDVRLRTIADKQMVITPCEFERARVDVQFAFNTAGEISGLAFRPAAAARAYTVPPYAHPSSYEEQALTIGSSDWPLPATLTLPVRAGSLPAVVLVHGSGPTDRDATVGANKPFKDLATGLASRGIAVLRYDKRTKVHGANAMTRTDFTVEQEVIEDVLEAAKALRAQPGIDPRRVFVLGHSLGGMLIPRIAMAGASPAGLIVLAGAARPLEEAMVAQTRYLAAADGTISGEEQETIDQARALAETVRALNPEEARSGRMIAGVPASYWLDLRDYDPPAAARSVKAPMLILHGERDYQVTSGEFAKWKSALGSRRDVRFHSYPALNHLFIAGAGPSLPAEYLTPGHVAEDVIRDIAAWIAATRP